MDDVGILISPVRFETLACVCVCAREFLLERRIHSDAKKIQNELVAENNSTRTAPRQT